MNFKKYIKIALFSFAIAALVPGFLIFGSKLANNLKAQFFQPDFSQPPPWETGGSSPFDMQFGMIPDFSQPPPWETGAGGGKGGKQSFGLPAGAIEGAQKGAIGLAELVETNEKLMNIVEKIGTNVEKGRKAADRIRPLAKKRADAIILKNDFDAADKFTNQIFEKDDYLVWFDYLTTENIRKDSSGQLREILKKNIEVMSTSLQFEEATGRDTKKMKAKIEQMKKVQKEVEKLPKAALKEMQEKKPIESPKEFMKESPRESPKESPKTNPIAPSSQLTPSPSSPGSSAGSSGSEGAGKTIQSGETNRQSSQMPFRKEEPGNEERKAAPERLNQPEKRTDLEAPSGVAGGASGVAVKGSQELAQTLSEIVETEKLSPKIEQKIETLAEKIEKIKVDKKIKKQLEKEIDRFMDKLEKSEISKKELEKVVTDFEKTLEKLTKSKKAPVKTADKKSKKRRK